MAKKTHLYEKILIDFSTYERLNNAEAQLLELKRKQQESSKFNDSSSSINEEKSSDGILKGFSDQSGDGPFLKVSHSGAKYPQCADDKHGFPPQDIISKPVHQDLNIDTNQEDDEEIILGGR